MNSKLRDNNNSNVPVSQLDNRLFPVFLKPEGLSILIVGAGLPALEVLHSVLQNSPSASIKLIGPKVEEGIKKLAAEHQEIQWYERAFEFADLHNSDLVFLTLSDLNFNKQIRDKAKSTGKLVHVTDQPDLCDFYIGPVVEKGHIKIAISSGGQSKTIARRLRDMINNIIPPEIEQTLENQSASAATANGTFYDRLKHLNSLAKVIMAKQIILDELKTPEDKQWQKIVKWCLFAFFFMLLGHGLLSIIPTAHVVDIIKSVPHYINSRSFLIMLLTGFLAQLVDGSLGMGYGTISTTFLLANGVNPAIVSSRVHSARVFSSGVSGYSHHRFGNINKKLFKTLVIPGVVGAISGAALAYYGQKYSSAIRVPLCIYTFYLGWYIVRKAFNRNKNIEKVRKAGWLASAGGFLDAFAGGGWGTLVTSTLIAKRRSPRYVIGSVCLAEFFVVLSSSITFFILLRSIPLGDVAGLIIGGLLAAPIAARMVGKLPLKTTFIIVGGFVLITSLNTLYHTISSLIK